MERLKSVLKSEFRLKQLGFSTIVSDRVFFSMWPIPPIAIILYKMVLAIYVDYWLFKTMHYKTVWGLWLTSWAYALLALHLTLSTLAVIVYHVIRSLKSRTSLFSRSPAEHWTLMQDDVSTREITTESHSTSSDHLGGSVSNTEQSSSTPWYVIAPVWIFFDMSATFVPLVTFLYFAVLWPNTTHVLGISMAELQLHGINTVCMFIDLLLSPIPVRILHVIYPVIYGLIYVIFSLIYWANGHRRPLYRVILDWNHAGRTGGIIVAIILVLFIVHLLLFTLHKLKVFIYLRLHSSDHSTSSQHRELHGLNGPCYHIESQSTLT